jgi:hypothetical protein
MLNPSTGAITGTAATAGTFSVKVTDAAGATGTSSPITINTALAVSGPAVTTGEVGAPFSSGPIIVIGGVGPDTFKIVGTVPAGLTLNPATGGITGTATSEGHRRRRRRRHQQPHHHHSGSVALGYEVSR